MRRACILLCALSLLAAADSDARKVRVGNLIYAGNMTSVCFSDRFLTTVAAETGINTEKRMHAVRLSRVDELAEAPFLVMNGQESFTLTAEERTHLKTHLERGGFLLASAGCSSEQWSASFRSEMQGIFGATAFQDIPLTHPALQTVFPLTAAPLSHGGSARFQGVILDGRLAVLFSKEGLNDTAHTQGCCCCGGNEVKPAEEIVANVLVYALVE
jgi:hypothetical protein